MLTIDPVLAETDFLIRSRLGAGAGDAFLEQILGGAVLREPVETADLTRAGEILAQFRDRGFGLTDAAVMAVGERLKAGVLTVDRRHFGVFRAGNGELLSLLP